MSNAPIPQILRVNSISVVERGRGARTIPLVNANIGSQRTISGITEFEPGASIPLHMHNCEETVMILEGAAMAHIDGTEHVMSAGDTSWIPPSVPHFFRNSSTDKKMRIYWTYASIDANRTIIATGVTTRIDEELGLAPSN